LLIKEDNGVYIIDLTWKGMAGVTKDDAVNPSGIIPFDAIFTHTQRGDGAYLSDSAVKANTFELGT
jgi:hypothetical protein